MKRFEPEFDEPKAFELEFDERKAFWFGLGNIIQGEHEGILIKLDPFLKHKFISK